MIAYCGLDCSKCEGYLATQSDDEERKAKVAKKWSEQYNADIRPEHINCDGCRQDGKKFFYCSDMCKIRKCCIERALENCAGCKDYMCDDLKGFVDFAPEIGELLKKLRAQL